MQQEQLRSLVAAQVRGQHGPIWGFLMQRAINPVMRRLLAGRFHRRIGSKMIMVLTFRGRAERQGVHVPDRLHAGRPRS